LLKKALLFIFAGMGNSKTIKPKEGRMVLRKLRPIIGLVAAIIFSGICFSAPVRSILSLPTQTRLVVGEISTLRLQLPELLEDVITLRPGNTAASVLASAEEPVVAVRADAEGYQITALQEGYAKLQVDLWGIPIKSINVESVPPRRLIPGGHSIGVILQSDGIMVVGYAPITDANGKKLYPAREQGLQIGDLLFQINGQGVKDENDLARIIDQNQGEALQVTLKRGANEKIITLNPVFCMETNRYRIGLYVRDGVVGVGTLSFYDPATNQYAALGHIIMDADTKSGIEVLEGKIVSAAIQMVKPGKPGLPGEKIGVFEPQGAVSGSIEKNTYYGIYGIMNQGVRNPLAEYPLEVRYAHQVQPGPAQILTVVNGQEIERFDIAIEKVYPERDNGKNLVIRVTDPRLLSITGGIVQGMSGSPIIQDDKLIGAVTHVLLNDPQSGYGVSMDYMLAEMPPL
jgi:stage IV sporulation protein B